MAKKDNIPNMKAPDVLKNNFMPYAMSVIMSRAIPEIDGLKPSHRKLLYTMYEMGLLSGGRTKSANVAARTMLLNPHGDCLRGDTVFEDLAGNRYTIKDLCEQNIKELECLSIDTETQKIERTKLTDFRIGQYAKTIYKITLQNGFVIEATSNHPFLCKTDKGIEYIKAENLKEGCVLFSESIAEEALNSYYEKNVVIKKIEKIELNLSEAMYDFTSSNNNNVLLPVNNNLWICVHNSAIYETAVRFTQNNETLLTPLIDGKGNFGKHYSRDTASAASRYCVTGDTLIPTNKGILPIKEIASHSAEEDFAPIDLTVKSLLGKNNHASKFFDSGKHETIKVELRNGLSITATPNHPLLTLNDRGYLNWKMVGELEEGDICAVDVSKGNALFGENNDLVEARMLGCMISEGCLTTQNRIAVINTDMNIIDPVYAYFKREKQNMTAKVHKRTQIDNCYEFCVCDKDEWNKFKNVYKIGRYANEKCIPPQVFQGTKEYQIEFLRYLFEGDGSAIITSGHNEVTYSSYSIKLIQELQILLLHNFGIFSYIKKCLKESGKYEYKLMFTPYDSCMFAQEIGFVSERKQEAALSITCPKMASNSYRVSAEISRRINREFNTTRGYGNAKGAEAFYKHFKNKPIYDMLKQYVYVPITSLTSAGIQTVYSLHVDSDCHSFAGNGFMNHNTEMKLMPVATEFFKSIKKDTVDFVDNYDSTRKEPTLLPVTFPNILANPTEGIAVGMASSIPSFNLSELCEATIMRIQHPKNDIKTVMPAPDFTTGAELLLNSDVIDDIYKTGKGSIVLRSKYTVDEKKRIIEVNEIPYSTTAEAIIEGIISLIKSNKITEISDIRNEIGLHGFRIAIDYKRGVDPKNLMMKLFRISKLQDSYSCNMTILINGKPRTAGVVEILDEWIKWRRVCVTRELIFDLNKKKNELHLLEGLAKVLLDIDKAIKIIRGTEDDVDVVPALMKGFDLTEVQAEYVSEIKLRNLNKNYILNKTKNIETLKDEIDDLQNKINSEKEIDKIIIKTLKEVQKKYGIPRKTEILTSFENVNSTSAVNVPDYPVKVFVTKEGYVKKVALTSIKNDPEIKFKDGDEVINIFESSNSKELLVFTNKANVYKVNLSELKDSKPSELPDIIYNYCDFEAGERDLYICTSDAGKSILIGYENGKVSKVPLSAYETKQNRKKLTNGYGTVSQPIGFFATDDDTDYTMESDKGKLLVFNCDKVPLKTTKSTQGVQVLRLTKDAKAIKLGKPEDYEIKSIDDYRSANIPGSGKVKP